MPAELTPPTETLTPRPGVAERLSRMIQLPTVSAELDSRGAQPFEDFVTLLAELYPVVHERLELERVTEFGLLFRWAGAAASAQPVVLMAHYDVVPVDESDAWTHPPFEGRVEDGWVYGRGALDDKGPLLVVLEAVENLLSAGFTPARDVYLSFGGNEETYGVRPPRSPPLCASAASCRGSCSTRAARSSTRRCRSLSGAPPWSASARRASSPCS